MYRNQAAHLEELATGGVRNFQKNSASKWENMAMRVAHDGILTERAKGSKPVVEPMLSIRRKMLALEILIAPELEDPKTVWDEASDPDPILAYQYYPEFIQQKWSLILQKSDNLRVKKLIDLMAEANVSQDTFLNTLGKFSYVPLKNINHHSRPVSTFTTEQIEYCLERHFSLEPLEDVDSAIKSITHVLLKA